MLQYLSILKQTTLFRGVNEEDIAPMLSCLGARLMTFHKGDVVLREGDEFHDIAVLVKGALFIQKDDYWGNRSILGQIAPCEVFAEAYAAPDSGPLLNDVIAAADSVVIVFDVSRVITTCSSACRFHAMVVQNFVFTMSEKNRTLVQKLRHMSERTTRRKLISYLSDQAKKHHSASFAIPFNRQQLADFLAIDRSAMSNELCKMRDEGLLSFEKNRFTLRQ